MSVITESSSQDTKNPLIRYHMHHPDDGGQVAANPDGGAPSQHTGTDSGATYGTVSRSYTTDTQPLSPDSLMDSSIANISSSSSSAIVDSVSRTEMSRTQTHTTTSYTATAVIGEQKTQIRKKSSSSSISDVDSSSSPHRVKKAGSKSSSRSGSFTESLPTPSPEEHRSHKHSHRQRELVRIPRSQVTMVTEKKGMTGVIPSEQIRPAHLPQHAISLVMPPEHFSNTDNVQTNAAKSDSVRQTDVFHNDDVDDINPDLTSKSPIVTTTYKHVIQHKTDIHTKQQVHQTMMVHIGESDNVVDRVRFAEQDADSSLDSKELAACAVSGHTVTSHQLTNEQAKHQHKSKQNHKRSATKPEDKDELVKQFMLQSEESSPQPTLEHSKSDAAMESLRSATQRALQTNTEMRARSREVMINREMQMIENVNQSETLIKKMHTELSNPGETKAKQVSDNLPQVPFDTSTPLKSEALPKEKKSKKKGTKKPKKAAQKLESEVMENSVDLNRMTDAADLPGDVTQNGMDTSLVDGLNRSASQNDDFLTKELDRVLREKVKLEGQLEILEKEARTAMKERAELQVRQSIMPALT